MLLSKILCLLLSAICIQAQYTGQHIANDLETLLSSSSSIYLPGTANYSQSTTPRWDTYINATYVVAVKPATIEDVQLTVRYASSHGIPFLTIGGGHGYVQTLSEMKNGISLDLGNFKGISVNPGANTATIGGAVRLKDFVRELQTYEKEMPVGSCPCIGVVGATLGSGVGPYTGLYGFMSDQLLSAEVVTGTGEILNVSQVENLGLFWGMRGAGANLGIVTSATYQIHDSVNSGNATNVDMVFPITLNGSVWEAVNEVTTDQAKELYLSVAIGYNSTINMSFIIANAVYAGSTNAATATLKPLLDLQPLNLNVSSLLWADIGYAADYGLINYGCTPQGEIGYSVNLPSINQSALIDITNYYTSTQASNPALQLSLLSIAMPGLHGPGLHAVNSSAYPWRDTVGYLQIQGSGATDLTGPAISAFGGGVRSTAMEAYGIGSGNLTTYVHFANGDEGEVAWYSAQNLPRLKRLKQRYDPLGMFRYYAPIEMRGWEGYE